MKLTRKELISKHKAYTSELIKASRHKASSSNFTIRTLQIRRVAKHHIKDYRKLTNQQLKELNREARASLELAKSRQQQPAKIYYTTFKEKFKEGKLDPYLYNMALENVLEQKKSFIYQSPLTKQKYELNISNLTASKLGAKDIYEESDLLYTASSHLGIDPKELRDLVTVMDDAEYIKFQEDIKKGDFKKAEERLYKGSIKESVYTSVSDFYKLMKKSSNTQATITRNYTQSMINAANKKQTDLEQLGKFIYSHPKQFINRVYPVIKQSGQFSDKVLSFMRQTAQTRLSQIKPVQSRKALKAKLEKKLTKELKERREEHKMYMKFERSKKAKAKRGRIRKQKALSKATTQKERNRIERELWRKEQLREKKQRAKSKKP